MFFPSGVPQESLRPCWSPSGSTGGIRLFPIYTLFFSTSPVRIPQVPLTLTFLTKQAPSPLLSPEPRLRPPRAADGLQARRGPWAPQAAPPRVAMATPPGAARRAAPPSRDGRVKMAGAAGGGTVGDLRGGFGGLGGHRQRWGEEFTGTAEAKGVREAEQPPDSPTGLQSEAWGSSWEPSGPPVAAVSERAAGSPPACVQGDAEFRQGPKAGDAELFKVWLTPVR